MSFLFFLLSINNDSSLSYSHTLIQGKSVPLGIASQYGHHEVVEMLLNAGAKINHRNKVMSMHLGILYSCIEIKICSRY